MSVSVPIRNIQADSKDQFQINLLSVASLFEGEFTIDWVIGVTGFKAHKVLPVLQEKVRDGALISPSPGTYEWTQSGKKNKLYKSIPTSKQQQFHQKIAEVLMSDLPESEGKIILLSQHLLKITNNFEGCHNLVLAGDHYRKIIQIKKASECYEKAIQDLESMNNPVANSLLAETAIKFSKVATATLNTDRIKNILHKALKRAESENMIHARIRLEMQIAYNDWIRGDLDSALIHYEKGSSLIGSTNDLYILRTEKTFRIMFLWCQGKYREAIEIYNRETSDVDSHHSKHIHNLAKIFVGTCYVKTGYVTQGLGLMDAIRNYCLQQGNIKLAAQTTGSIGEAMMSIRRIKEGIKYMEKAVWLANKADCRFTWITSQIILAFAYHKSDQNERAVKHLKAYLQHSRDLHFLAPHTTPYLLELIYAMRVGQMPQVGNFSLENEVDRMLGSSNIYMQGLGHHYKALLKNEQSANFEVIEKLFQTAIDCMVQSGHVVPQSLSRIELARHYLKSGFKEIAEKIINETAALLRNFEDSVIPRDLHNMISKPQNRDHLLGEIMNLGQQVAMIRNHKELMQMIISSVNRITGAERGAIFLLDHKNPAGNVLNLRASKNLTTKDVEESLFRTSLKLIHEVAHTGKSVVRTLENNSSAAKDYIKSIICVPMLLGRDVVGVLYHDNRLLASVFKETDIEILSYFAGQAAIAIENANAYEEIRQLNFRLTEEKKYLEAEQKKTNFDEIIGNSPVTRHLMGLIRQVAETEATVLITGETGVGKELVARAIHLNSKRAKKPFISIQLGSLPESLISTELFGHEKGAFTGAGQRLTGRLELANSGTLFLDEIGDCSLDIQVKLLRVLQSRKFERIGGTQTLSTDFRLIAATNKDLEHEVQTKNFRSDLFYRLNVVPIHVPPLRERREDIPLLANHFLRINSGKMGKMLEPISKAAMDKLIAYDWPGNIRELENVIERGVILCRGTQFPIPDLGNFSSEESQQNNLNTLAENERLHLIQALKMRDWKVCGPQGAAKALGLKPTTMYFRMKKLGILTSRSQKKGE